MESPPKLSKGFFQEYLDNKIKAGTYPVLQILSNSRVTNTSNYKLCLSDGDFSYR